MPLFSKSKGHEICQQKNLVAINEFFNSDVDIYHLERIALRCVSLHNIFVSFFFLHWTSSRRKLEHYEINNFKEGRKYMTTPNKVRLLPFFAKYNLSRPVCLRLTILTYHEYFLFVSPLSTKYLNIKC